MQVPSFILEHSNIKDSKSWHFYLLIAWWASLYTVMNISIVLFLQYALKSIALAGAALAVWSCFALLFDWVFSYIQKVFSTRTLFLSSIVWMMFSIILFMLGVNIALVFIATIFFRISFDLCDITAVSSILSKSLPAEYGQNLSYKQLAQWLWMISWLVISAILFKASYLIESTAKTGADFINVENSFITTLFMMKVSILILLIVLFCFAFLLFDKNILHLSKDNILYSFQKLEADTIDNLKHKYTEIVKNVREKISKPNQITLKSNKSKLNTKELLWELTWAIKTSISFFTKRPLNLGLVWSITVMSIFSYWDTFLMTFLPIFFTEVLQTQQWFLKWMPGSLLLLIFILPVLWLLPIVAKKADKMGRSTFMIFGMILTAFSCLVIGMISKSNFTIIFLAGFGISFGYLFAMSSAKANTAAKISEFLAVENDKKEIDSHSSAWPMSLIDNVGNIIWPLVGGIMIYLFGFQGFLLIFAVFLIIIIISTMKRYNKITGHSYVFQSPVKLTDNK